MRNVTMKILLTFFFRTSAGEMALSPTNDSQNAATKSVDQVIDNLLGKLVDRELSSQSVQNTDLDDTVFGKSAHLATLPQSPGVLQTRPLIPYSAICQRVIPVVNQYNSRPVLVQAEGEGTATLPARQSTSGAKTKVIMNELRSKNSEQLIKALDDLETEGLKLIISKCTRDEEWAPHKWWGVKKQIAQILTVYTEKQKAEGLETYPPIPTPYPQRATNRERRAYRDSFKPGGSRADQRLPKDQLREKRYKRGARK